MKTATACRNWKCCCVAPEVSDARVSHNDIGPLYDRLSRLYDIWGKATESRARDRAIELANIKDGQSVLEVAVGTGLAFRKMVRQNPNGLNIGVDLSNGMLRKARKRLSHVDPASYSLHVGSAFALEVGDGTMDVLVNNYMFDLIPFKDMGRVLVEFKRVLRKGGKLVLVNMTRGERPASLVYEWLYRLSPETMGGCRGVTMADRLIENGFRVETREYIQQMLFPSEILLAYND